MNENGLRMPPVRNRSTVSWAMSNASSHTAGSEREDRPGAVEQRLRVAVDGTTVSQAGSDLRQLRGELMPHLGLPAGNVERERRQQTSFLDAIAMRPGKILGGKYAGPGL